MHFEVVLLIVTKAHDFNDEIYSKDKFTDKITYKLNTGKEQWRVTAHISLTWHLRNRGK